MQPTQQPNDSGKTLGVVGFVVQFFWGLPGLLLGIAGFVKSKRGGYKNGLAVAAIILGSLRTLIETIIVLPPIIIWALTLISNAFMTPNITAAEHEITAVRGVTAASVSVVQSWYGYSETRVHVSLAEPAPDTFRNALPDIAYALTNTNNLPSVDAWITIVDAPAGSSSEQVRQSPVVHDIIRDGFTQHGDIRADSNFSDSVRFSKDVLSRLSEGSRKQRSATTDQESLAIENAAKKSIDGVGYVRVDISRMFGQHGTKVEMDIDRGDISANELRRVLTVICSATTVHYGYLHVTMFATSTGGEIDLEPAVDGLPPEFDARDYSRGEVSLSCYDVK